MNKKRSLQILYVISIPQLCIKVEGMSFYKKKYFEAKQQSLNKAYQNHIKIQVGNSSPTHMLKINEK